MPDTFCAYALHAEKVLNVGPVDPVKYPLPKMRLTLEFLREYIHLVFFRPEEPLDEPLPKDRTKRSSTPFTDGKSRFILKGPGFKLNLQPRTLYSVVGSIAVMN